MVVLGWQDVSVSHNYTVRFIDLCVWLHSPLRHYNDGTVVLFSHILTFVHDIVARDRCMIQNPELCCISFNPFQKSQYSRTVQIYFHIVCFFLLMTYDYEEYDSNSKKCWKVRRVICKQKQNTVICRSYWTNILLTIGHRKQIRC